MKQCSNCAHCGDPCIGNRCGHCKDKLNPGGVLTMDMLMDGMAEMMKFTGPTQAELDAQRKFEQWFHTLSNDDKAVVFSIVNLGRW